jgi:hypothetical protein
MNQCITLLKDWILEIRYAFAFWYEVQVPNKRQSRRVAITHATAQHVVFTEQQEHQQ